MLRAVAGHRRLFVGELALDCLGLDCREARALVREAVEELRQAGLIETDSMRSRCIATPAGRMAVFTLEAR